MRVALIYDRVNKWGGAERVLLALNQLFPQAPLYTAVYNQETATWAKAFPQVIPSFLQKFPGARTGHEFYPWLTPLAFESFDFSGFELVISVTSEAAKGIITKPGTFHLCYCLTPTRYLWSGYDIYFQNPALKFVLAPLVAYLRQWDRIAAWRTDAFLATSANVAKRIKNYYHRESIVIWPPVDTSFFVPGGRKKDYFLLVSRLVPYKRVDLAVEAFNSLGYPLKIVGSGRQFNKLKSAASSNIKFLGEVSDGELVRLYQGAKAVIFPQEEDFGLVPLEAQACGTPVIAFRGGGALETIVAGKTGEFFTPRTAQALTGVVFKFDPSSYQTRTIRENALKFDRSRFLQKFKLVVEQALAKA